MYENLDIAGEEAAKGSWGQFGLVGRDKGFDNSDSKVGEDPADGELNPAFGCALNCEVCEQLRPRAAALYSLITATIWITERTYMVFLNPSLPSRGSKIAQPTSLPVQFTVDGIDQSDDSGLGEWQTYPSS